MSREETTNDHHNVIVLDPPAGGAMNVAVLLGQLSRVQKGIQQARSPVHYNQPSLEKCGQY